MTVFGMTRFLTNKYLPTGMVSTEVKTNIQKKLSTLFYFGIKSYKTSDFNWTPSDIRIEKTSN